MTKDELIKRLQAGEQVTLYFPKASYVGVGSRTFAIEPAEKDLFRIHYGNGDISKYTHSLDSPLLDSLFKSGQMIELWWVAYARSVARNQERDKDA